MYENGIGFDKDLKTAEEWYERAQGGTIQNPLHSAHIRRSRSAPVKSCLQTNKRTESVIV